jgi:hypothetical protein
VNIADGVKEGIHIIQPVEKHYGGIHHEELQSCLEWKRDESASHQPVDDGKEYF